MITILNQNPFLNCLEFCLFLCSHICGRSFNILDDYNSKSKCFSQLFGILYSSLFSHVLYLSMSWMITILNHKFLCLQIKYTHYLIIYIFFLLYVYLNDMSMIECSESLLTISNFTSLLYLNFDILYIVLNN